MVTSCWSQSVSFRSGDTDRRCYTPIEENSSIAGGDQLRMQHVGLCGNSYYATAYDVSWPFPCLLLVQHTIATKSEIRKG